MGDKMGDKVKWELLSIEAVRFEKGDILPFGFPTGPVFGARLFPYFLSKIELFFGPSPAGALARRALRAGNPLRGEAPGGPAQSW